MPSDSSALSLYLANIGKIPMLTAAEEIDLSKAVREMLALEKELSFSGLAPTVSEQKRLKRGKRAMERMQTANLRLVVTVCKKYSDKCASMNLDLMDLIQEGSIGLRRAVQLFDPTRGYKFSTYSYWWIRQAVFRCIALQGRSIRLPINGLEVLRKLKIWIPEFKQEFGRLPTIAECAESVPTTASSVERLLAHTTPVRSLNERVRNDVENSALIDLIAVEIAVTEESDPMLEQLPHLLTHLSTEERWVVDASFGLNRDKRLSPSQLSRESGESSQRILELKDQALQKLRAVV